MRTMVTRTVLASVFILILAAVICESLANPTRGAGGGGPKGSAPTPTAQPPDGRFTPYASDPNQLWNRLHAGLFVREAPDGSRRIHVTDPLLYQGGTFLLEGKSHRRAVALLDEFLAKPGEPPADDPVKRLFLQRDLWAAFDYAAWSPDEWIHYARNETAAIALRNRLAKAIGRLALGGRQFDSLPDNYALAVKSKEYAVEADAKHPDRPFLPADLFDPAGSWVRFQDTMGRPMAERHFAAAEGRAVHIIFLRLPAGRAATQKYLKELNGESIEQFPPGTMVAMVRRALAIDQSAKIRVTPVTEMVQIRVYRRIPRDPIANFNGDVGEQDVFEFVLDRTRLFAGQHGLRAVSPNDPAEPFEKGDDPFDRKGPNKRPAEDEVKTPQLKTCIQCHQQPGAYSVLSMKRGLKEGLKGPGFDNFRTYAWDVEMSYTMKEKAKQYNWGLLQGKLEAK